MGRGDASSDVLDVCCYLLVLNRCMVGLGTRSGRGRRCAAEGFVELLFTLVWFPFMWVVSCTL